MISLIRRDNPASGRKYRQGRAGVLAAQVHDDPVEIARQQNWGQDALAKAQTLANQENQATSGHEDGRPATYDSAIDTAYNHSMGIRKGHIR